MRMMSATSLRRLALDGVLAMRQGVTQDVARDLFPARTRIYVNLTAVRFIRQTIGEAMAAGCVCVVANDALKGILPDRFVSKDGSGIAAALEMPEAERRELVTRSRAYVEKEHSLALLTEKLVGPSLLNMYERGRDHHYASRCRGSGARGRR